MDAKSLMIGDWVQIGTLQAKVIRLHQHYVDVMTERGTEIHTTYQEVSPILLKEEILKANGFVQVHNLENNPYMFSYKLEPKWNCFPVCISGKYYDTIIILNYVHELQHALRLCGVIELADKFKLKTIE